MTTLNNQSNYVKALSSFNKTLLNVLVTSTFLGLNIVEAQTITRPSAPTSGGTVVSTPTSGTVAISTRAAVSGGGGYATQATSYTSTVRTPPATITRLPVTVTPTPVTITRAPVIATSTPVTITRPPVVATPTPPAIVEPSVAVHPVSQSDEQQDEPTSKDSKEPKETAENTTDVTREHTKPQKPDGKPVQPTPPTTVYVPPPAVVVNTFDTNKDNRIGSSIRAGANIGYGPVINSDSGRRTVDNNQISISSISAMIKNLNAYNVDQAVDDAADNEADELEVEDIADDDEVNEPKNADEEVQAAQAEVDEIEAEKERRRNLSKADRARERNVQERLDLEDQGTRLDEEINQYNDDQANNEAAKIENQNKLDQLNKDRQAAVKEGNKKAQLDIEAQLKTEVKIKNELQERTNELGQQGRDLGRTQTELAKKKANNVKDLNRIPMTTAEKSAHNAAKSVDKYNSQIGQLQQEVKRLKDTGRNKAADGVQAEINRRTIARDAVVSKHINKLEEVTKKQDDKVNKLDKDEGMTKRDKAKLARAMALQAKYQARLDQAKQNQEDGKPFTFERDPAPTLGGLKSIQSADLKTKTKELKRDLKGKTRAAKKEAKEAKQAHQLASQIIKTPLKTLNVADSNSSSFDKNIEKVASVSTNGENVSQQEKSLNVTTAVVAKKQVVRNSQPDDSLNATIDLPAKETREHIKNQSNNLADFSGLQQDGSNEGSIDIANNTVESTILVVNSDDAGTRSNTSSSVQSEQADIRALSQHTADNDKHFLAAEEKRSYEELVAKRKEIEHRLSILNDNIIKAAEKGDRALETNLASQHDTLHDSTITLFEHTDNERAEMTQRRIVRDNLVDEISNMARQKIHEDMAVSELIADAKGGATAVGQWVSIGADIQNQMKKAVRTATRERALADAKLELISNKMGQADTTKVEKDILKSMRRLAVVQKSGAQEMLDSADSIAVVGYAADLVTTVGTGGGALLLKGGAKLTGKVVGKVVAKKVTKELGKKAGKEAGEAAANKFVAKTTQAGLSELGKDGANLIGKKVGNQVAKNTAKEVTKQNIAKGMSTEAAQSLGQKTGKEAGEKATKAFVDNTTTSAGVKKIVEKTSNKIGNAIIGTARTVGGETGEQVVKAAAKKSIQVASATGEMITKGAKAATDTAVGKKVISATKTTGLALKNTVEVLSTDIRDIPLTLTGQTVQKPGVQVVKNYGRSMNDSPVGMQSGSTQVLDTTGARTGPGSTQVLDTTGVKTGPGSTQVLDTIGLRTGPGSTQILNTTSPSRILKGIDPGGTTILDNPMGRDVGSNTWIGDVVNGTESAVLPTPKGAIVLREPGFTKGMKPNEVSELFRPGIELTKDQMERKVDILIGKNGAAPRPKARASNLPEINHLPNGHPLKPDATNHEFWDNFFERKLGNNSPNPSVGLASQNNTHGVVRTGPGSTQVLDTPVTNSMPKGNDPGGTTILDYPKGKKLDVKLGKKNTATPKQAGYGPTGTEVMSSPKRSTVVDKPTIENRTSFEEETHILSVFDKETVILRPNIKVSKLNKKTGNRGLKPTFENRTSFEEETHILSVFDRETVILRPDINVTSQDITR